MHLVEVFVPLSDNEGRPFDRSMHKSIERDLTNHFGGVTAYPRAPASGIWKVSSTENQHDDLIVYEVMVKKLDRDWWREYRRKLEKLFSQESLLVRAHAIELL